jgi:hypothetical protein
MVKRSKKCCKALSLRFAGEECGDGKEYGGIEVVMKGVIFSPQSCKTSNAHKNLTIVRQTEFQ